MVTMRRLGLGMADKPFCSLSSSSNCSTAIYSFSNLPLVPSNRLNLNITFTSSLHSPITLRAINVGTGTTGTRSINSRICEVYKISTLHYDKICNLRSPSSRSPPRPPLTRALQWIINLVQCTPKRCRSSKILRFYPKFLELIVTSFDYVSDFPLGEIFPDLLLWVPDLIVISSLRDPVIWARRRLDEHANTPICHPDLWNHPLIYHPFDIIACLTLRDYTNEALVPISYLTDIDQLITAYIKYNTFNFVYATSQNLSYHSICLWDPDSTLDSGQAALTEIWKLHPQTHSFLKKIDEPVGKNKPKWFPNATLPMMKQLFERKIEKEFTTGAVEEVLHSPILLPLVKSELLDYHKTFNLSLSARVIILAPRLSDILLFYSFLCPEISVSSALSPSSQSCQLLRINLSSLPLSQLNFPHTNSVLSMSQRWYQKLLSCYSNPSLPCQTSSLLNSYSAVVESLFSSSPYLILSLSTVDHLPSLLPFLFPPYSSLVPPSSPPLRVASAASAAAAPSPLILTLHYPPHVISSIISRNKHILVCRPFLWTHPKLVHPFDVVTCLQLTPSISATHSLLPISSLSSQQIQKIMNRYYNYYNRLLIHSSSASNRISVDLISILRDESQSSGSGTNSSSCALSKDSYRAQLRQSILTNLEEALRPVITSSHNLSSRNRILSAEKKNPSPDVAFSLSLFLSLSLGILLLLFLTRRVKKIISSPFDFRELPITQHKRPSQPL